MPQYRGSRDSITRLHLKTRRYQEMPWPCAAPPRALRSRPGVGGNSDPPKRAKDFRPAQFSQVPEQEQWSLTPFGRADTQVKKLIH